MRHLEMLIEEGPKLAAEERRRRRDEMIERATHAGSFEMPPSIHAHKYNVSIGTTVSRPKLRAEQRAQRVTFLLLLVTLSVLVFFLISKIGG